MSDIPSEPSITYPRYFVSRDATAQSIEYYSSVTDHHRSILSMITPAAQAARPLMFITILPDVDYGKASSVHNTMVEARYEEIDRELLILKNDPFAEEVVEKGAIDTARALVTQIRRKDIAPPELSIMGTEAIIMLWVIGRKKLALTITDGEFGYTLREDGKTIRRVTNVAPSKLNLPGIR